MREHFEIGGAKVDITLQQPHAYKVKDSDVRCIAHIINLAVQNTIKH
jgi:hypothetical protein